MSFGLPIILISCILLLLCIIGYVPGLFELSTQGIENVSNFLTVFGNGRRFEGLVTIGFTLSIVGISLDILNFYLYQKCER
ncbi:hypothetical protein NIES4102_26790 [Chondrocystis sp. NIES-4102]|nr:hypothetical protein NIES4102_26790 [Chondrocystis sp. NIES-4102]